MKRLFLLACLLSGCGGSGDVDEEGVAAPEQPSVPEPIPNVAPVPAPTTLACPKGTHLTYENFGESFLRNYCTSCHSRNVPAELRGGSPVGANFDDANDASLWRAAMLAKAGTDAATMPPINNVSSLERGQFAEWLNCGAPRS